MNLQVVGVYREPEFSPGKVAADRAIMDAVLDQLHDAGAAITGLEAAELAVGVRSQAQLVLAMCQGPATLKRLASMEESGALVINSALAIRNCYRDLLGAGLVNARVPAPAGRLIDTTAPLDLKSVKALDLTAPIFVKRGDLHALGPDDVQRVEGAAELEVAMADFAGRGIARVYAQQEVRGEVVKFYGIGDGSEYFAAISETDTEIEEPVRRDLAHAAGAVASTLGLAVWGGDAIVNKRELALIDFNDWPSFSRVRDEAATAITRHCLKRLRQGPQPREVLA